MNSSQKNPPTNSIPSPALLELLNALSGKKVAVAIVPDAVTRNHFGAQIAVSGLLEIKTSPPSNSPSNPSFRVLSNPENFAYFTLGEIVFVNTLTKLPTITLSIPVSVNS